MTSNYESYDFLRRGSRRSGALGSISRSNTQSHRASASPSVSPRRRPLDGSTRNSNTTNTTITANSARTSATNLTQPPSFSKKFVVVGDGGCGKTCLLISYSQGYFPEKYVPTVFENYITHKEHRATGKTVELALWDTAGQEEYDRLRPLSYPDTDLIFVCFAIDCPNSLENVMDKWFPEVLHFCPTTPLILTGLKSDLRMRKACIDLLKTQGLTPVTQEQGQKVAKQMGATYVECSSKEMRGVQEIFDLAMDTAIGYELKLREDKARWTQQAPRPCAESNGAFGFASRRHGKKRCLIL